MIQTQSLLEYSTLLIFEINHLIIQQVAQVVVKPGCLLLTRFEQLSSRFVQLTLLKIVALSAR